MLQDPRVLQDPKVAALVANAQNAKTNEEALKYSLLLEEFLLGEHALTQDPDRRGELQHVMADAEARDRAEAAFEADEQGFINDIFNRSESKKLTGAKADEARAKAGVMMSKAIRGELSLQRMKQAELDYQIEHGPKVTVQAEGQWVQKGSAPNTQNVLEPERLQIMHRVWVLEPGTNFDVPKVFADHYERILQSRAETREREKVMGKGDKHAVQGMEASQLEAALMKIDRKYAVKRQLPT